MGSVSNGVQGAVPAIRKVQQRLDHDLEQRQIDINSFKVQERFMVPRFNRSFDLPGLKYFCRKQALCVI